MSPQVRQQAFAVAVRRPGRTHRSAPASSLQIEQSKIRLQRLGYFETVEVDTVEVAGTEDQIDVNYDVLEQNFGAISFQVGTGGGGNFFISCSDPTSILSTDCLPRFASTSVRDSKAGAVR